MKKICAVIVLLGIIVCLFGGCHTAEKEKLRYWMECDVDDEDVYTSASYQDYMEAYAFAEEVIDNAFATKSQIQSASDDLQYAIDHLTKATKGVYSIQCRWALLSNNHVGNDWTKQVLYNQKDVASTDIVASLDSKISLTAIVTENDTVPDTAKQNIQIYLSDNSQTTAEIKVIENRGRYKGNAAVWQLVCTVMLVSRI